MGKFKFNLLDFWVPNPQKRFSDVLAGIEKCVNTPEFMQWFMMESFTELQLEHRRLTKQQLLETVRKEVAIEYYVVKKKWYQRFSSVIGFTDDNVISTYSDFYFSMSDAELAGHIFHETLHAAGHSHSFNPSASREASLPYKCGYWVEKNFDKVPWPHG